MANFQSVTCQNSTQQPPYSFPFRTFCWVKTLSLEDDHSFFATWAQILEGGNLAILTINSNLMCWNRRIPIWLQAMSWNFYYGSMKNVLIRGANLIKNQDFIELSKPSLKLFQVFELKAYNHFLSKFQLPKIFLNSRSPTQKPHVLRTMYT